MIIFTPSDIVKYAQYCEGGAAFLLIIQTLQSHKQTNKHKYKDTLVSDVRARFTFLQMPLLFTQTVFVLDDFRFSVCFSLVSNISSSPCLICTLGASLCFLLFHPSVELQISGLCFY